MMVVMVMMIGKTMQQCVSNIEDKLQNNVDFVQMMKVTTMIWIILLLK